MHLQKREEGLVKRGGRHRRRGEHGDLRTHARIDDDVLARGGADGLNDLGNVRVFEAGRDALGVGTVGDGLSRGLLRTGTDRGGR